MNYDKFKRELYRAIICREEVAGNRVCLMGSQQDVLCISDEEDAEFIVCTPMQNLYESYCHRNLACVVDEIVGKVRLDAFLKKYALTLRPLNYHENRLELKDAVYKRFGDISLVLYAVMFEYGRDAVTVKIARSETDERHISGEVLVDEAINVTGRKRPPRLYYGTELEGEYAPDRGVFMPDETGEQIEIHNRDVREGMQGYRLTVLGHVNGAVAIFYPGVKERLAELLEGDYYVGFISVHEVAVHPVRHKSLGEMKTAIARANILREPREKLTDRVYRYSSSQKRLVEV